VSVTSRTRANLAREASLKRPETRRDSDFRFDGVQEAFEGLRVVDPNAVSLERDGAHSGEGLEASRHMDSNRTDHGGDVILTKTGPEQENLFALSPDRVNEHIFASVRYFGCNGMIRISDRWVENQRGYGARR